MRLQHCVAVALSFGPRPISSSLVGTQNWEWAYVHVCTSNLALYSSLHIQLTLLVPKDTRSTQTLPKLSRYVD